MGAEVENRLAGFEMAPTYPDEREDENTTSMRQLQSASKMIKRSRPFLLPPGAFDTHAHVFDPLIGPYATGRAYTPEDASLQKLLAFNKTLSAEQKPTKLVLVQPSPYKTDCTVLMKCLEELRRRDITAYGIVVIDLKRVTDHELGEMHRLGARGAECIPSERLVVQQVSDTRECNALRARLDALQYRYDGLLREFEQMRMQRSTGSDPPNHNNNYAAIRPHLNDDWPVELDSRSSSRILQPTFSQRAEAKGMSRSALSSAWELWGDDTTPVNDTPQPVNLAEFDRAAYEDLVDVFFTYRWPYLPVLHRQSFINKHLSPFVEGSNVSPVSTFMVNIVCAIAAAERSRVRPGHDKIHRLFFEAAVKYLSAIMSTDDFECIQCLLLLCMYGHNEPQSVNMWYTIGMALHLAVGIDLHRKESLSCLDSLHAEMVKRVFWSTYVMNCSMAINMGRPLGIQESDITTPLPLQLTDDQLNLPQALPKPIETLIPQSTDTSTFIHIIKLRRLNAGIYQKFHSIGSTATQQEELRKDRESYFSELNHWLITAPRYIGTACTFQSMEWFQIAFHHAVLSLYRPSRAAPMLSSSDLRVCTESAIGLISSYSSLYARNKIKYTFVAIHSLFMAAVTMLYALRASPPLRQELTKPVVQTNVLTFLTLFRGISNGRVVGEKCSNIVERLGNSILTLFDNELASDSAVGAEVDIEFQSWFGLQTHTAAPLATHPALSDDPHGVPSHFPDVRVDIPWSDLFVEGIDIGSTDFWNIMS
ncbi:hypothetical protein N8T08_007173 [Aspergillus melleus]|uniref:Uncharacterized protein n=1 Tax=Aspergillus melleus TaxID=138277 RepID=A0ACC3AYS4_9EURO|nr:hypothetical protein N8T08_007173 [Aspergillus melleus]